MRFCSLLIVLFLTAACQQEKELPYLGNHTKNTDDSIAYFKVPDFELRNQDSILITPKTLKDKIYIADFIFLKCPTICPVMNREMKRVYDAYQNNDNVVFVSHTIDPKNDSIPALKNYQEALGVKADKWHFLHGNQEDMFALAETGYYTQAYQEDSAPGGYAHSAGFVLVDKNRHIRGVYDGTNPTDVDRLIKEIEILIPKK